jgi:hypothetical protein
MLGILQVGERRQCIITSGTSPGRMFAWATACQPTAIGSVSAAISVGSLSGTAISMDSFSTDAMFAAMIGRSCQAIRDLGTLAAAVTDTG